MAFHRINNLRIAAGDNYALPAMLGNFSEIVEGSFMPDTFGVTYAIAGDGTPSSSAGIAVAVGQPINVGPRTTPGAGFRLCDFYFRNTTPGSNGFVNFNGSIDDGKDSIFDIAPSWWQGTTL